MDSLAGFVKKLAEVIVNPLIQLMFAVALVYFLWGVFEMVRESDSDEARNTGRQHMLWGLVGMAIMVSVFGIIQMLLNTFGISDPVINEVLPSPR